MGLVIEDFRTGTVRVACTSTIFNRFELSYLERSSSVLGPGTLLIVSFSPLGCPLSAR